MSSPTPIPVEDLGLPSPFQTRVVLEDHSKVALQALAALDHPLIIDLIDERFKLLDSGSGLVTESLPFRQSVLPTILEYTSVEEDVDLKPGGPFAAAAGALGETLDVQVVIHRAFWATKASSGEALEKAALAARTNEWLARAYDALEAAIPGSISVEPGSCVTVADPEHRWGLAPFHYPPTYYDILRSQVLDVVG